MSLEEEAAEEDAELDESDEQLHLSILRTGFCSLLSRVLGLCLMLRLEQEDENKEARLRFERMTHGWS